MRFIKSVLLTTLIIESTGAALNFIVFCQDYPPLKALGISLFHSVAAFNNSGFDILGNLQNLIPYRDDVLLNLITCGLIFFGGIGFLVIREMWSHKFRWKKYSMHAKIVLTVSAALIVVGTLLLKLTEDVTWLGAFFHSVSARTAGFSTYPLGNFSNAGLLVLTVLMFIGASPGSTGGGVKTSTFFVLIQGIKAAATNKSEKAFRHAIPKDAFRKAAVVTLLALAVVVTGTCQRLRHGGPLHRHHNGTGRGCQALVHPGHVHRQTGAADGGLPVVLLTGRAGQLPGGQCGNRLMIGINRSKIVCLEKVRATT